MGSEKDAVLTVAQRKEVVHSLSLIALTVMLLVRVFHFGPWDRFAEARGDITLGDGVIHTGGVSEVETGLHDLNNSRSP